MTDLAERFAAAVRILVGDGPIKERLGRAYSEHLEAIDPAALPPSSRPAYLELSDALHRVPPVGKVGRVRASVQKMSAAEAARHARAIVQLLVEINRPAERAEPLKVVTGASGAAQKPPRFLTGRS
ncbi:MAG TPA: hypothetical protein VF322_05590 [Gammaproteobacteria bacterium]